MKKKFLWWIGLLFIGGTLGFYNFLQPSHYEARFPIDFIPYSGQPRTEVEIEGHSYPLMIDLGSSSYLTLTSEILDKIDKQPAGYISTIDLKGNEYRSRACRIPQIKIRNMVISKLEAIEEEEGFLA